MLEALATAAWPATHVQQVPGWTLRHTPGAPWRRVNSALPDPLAGAADVDPVTRHYTGLGLRPCVQVTPLELHEALDARLAARGWTAEGATAVLTAALQETIAAASPAQSTSATVTVNERWSAAWLGAWAVAEALPERSAAREALARIPSPCAFALARLDDGPVGVGLAVRSRGWAGVFALATVPGARRRGVAKTVLWALAQWAQAGGADRLYLQVEDDNASARALYEHLGFVRSHGYHYRTAPLDASA